jgi:hypothetical protein
VNGGINLNLNVVAHINDGGLTIGADESSCPLEHFVRANNNVAWKTIQLTGEEHLDPIIISVSPNPAGTQTIVSYELGNQNSVNLILTDPTGNIVFSTPAVPETMKTIDIHSFPSGRYEVRLEAQGILYDNKPLIINR